MSLISLKDVNYKYPGEEQYVLKDVNLEIEEGKFYSLCGVNGSGKSTLCLLLRSFIPNVYKGTVEGKANILGCDINNVDLSSICTEIGYVFQNPFTQMSMTKDTVYEEIAFGLENLGVERLEMIRRVDEMVEYFGFEDLVDKNPQQLSGGQKQKVAIASVVVMNPRVLILDEPTSQLDPTATAEIFELLSRLNSEGTTIIVVEHKMELLTEYINEMIILHQGTVLMQGSAKDCFASENYTKANLLYPDYYLLGEELKQSGIINESLTSYSLAKEILQGKVKHDSSK